VAESTFITRMMLKNYKSIAYCDVELGPLTFLVGRNGSGKSNFLDALHFIAAALRSGLDQAVRERGNFGDIRFKGADPDTPVGFCLDMRLPEGLEGRYTLSLIPDQSAGYRVLEERCSISYPRTGHKSTGFHIRDRMHVHQPNWPADMPAVQPKQLYLPLSPDMHVRSAYEALSGMVFYNPIPAHMRGLSPHDQGDLLLQDGSNCAGVLLRLAESQPDAMERITEYARAILPSLKWITGKAVSDYDVLEFCQNGSGEAHIFSQTAMSDGTLHAIAVLVALFQDGFSVSRTHALIGIEEPEAALHPAATAVLRDAIGEAAELSQILVTTQSADLLDSKDIPAEYLLAAIFQDGATHLGPLIEGQRSIIRDHLSTAGDLLRTGNFRPVTTAQVEMTSIV
jgi:predicted ATPase